MSNFIFDGIDSADYDVYVYSTDSLNQAPARQYTTLTVPGRSGELLIDDKRFENTTRIYGVVSPEDGKQNMASLMLALASHAGYARLEDSFDTSHYFMAVYSEGYAPVIDARTDMGKVNITFQRKPQRYLKSGETPVTFTSGNSIRNPTRFASKPLIRVYGNGVLGVGSANITITGNTYSYADIDCESGRAYYGTTSLDSKIRLNTIDYPELAPGNNGIALGTGITSVIITPRWWEL